ncbi:prepilin-type N-terminal cleavage/methylation domain-containing protein [Photobacterium satsumensis]|uniref:prepilin-type N-terminal cleavage/methylation domain-containing protein n=1 Tax=Photobacterium satsumensis TaxID=2910239 RepID=UPI003D0C38C0
MKKQAGFSLVELVIVIIVVGLLAVAALPRFLNVTDEAKKAQIEGVAGSYATAVLSVRAQWEAFGRPETAGRNIVDYDGTDFYLTQDGDKDSPRIGYPTATRKVAADGIESTDCVTLMKELLQNPPKVTLNESDAKSGQFQFYGVKEETDDGRVCRYYQLASTGSNGNGTTDVTSGHFFTYQPMKGSVEVEIR